MNDRETRRYDMFGRVQTFGTDNAADFAAGSEAQKRFANIAQIIKDLDAARAGQQGGGGTSKEVLLDALRLDLQNITRTARAIAQDEPGFADNFRPPDSPSQSALLAAADAFLSLLQAPDNASTTKAAKTKAAKAAAPNAIAAKFIAHELPDDFVQNLADDRAAISDAQDASQSDDSQGVQSTAAIGRLIKAGMKEVNYLDAIIHNKYARNPDKLRAWESASHIERAPQREKKPAPRPTSLDQPAKS